LAFLSVPSLHLVIISHVSIKRVLCVVRFQCISMEQTVWLLGVLCLQVCLLSTTALPGQDRRTAAFQTNQAMGGSSPFLPGPPPQVDMKPLVVQLRAKRHEESVADGDKRKGCSGHRPGSCSVVRRPPPPKSSRTKRQERTKDRRKRPYRPGALAVISDPTVPPYRSSA
ncbi:hypothetical protein J4Q44_G00185630, partial [Coregonus suidteri]